MKNHLKCHIPKNGYDEKSSQMSHIQKMGAPFFTPTFFAMQRTRLGGWIQEITRQLEQLSKFLSSLDKHRAAVKEQAGVGVSVSGEPWTIGCWQMLTMVGIIWYSWILVDMSEY